METEIIERLQDGTTAYIEAIEETINEALQTKDVNLILNIMNKVILETLATYVAIANAIICYLDKYADNEQDKKTLEEWINRIARQTADAFNDTFKSTKLTVIQ